MGVPSAVAAAKLWLVSSGTADLPYLSEGLYALVTVESDAVASVAADESWRLYVNPEWAQGASIEELAREIAHQLWHLLLDHAGRARLAGVDRAGADAWAMASDLAVCDALMAEGVVPQRLIDRVRELRARRPDLATHRSTEEYWALTNRADFLPQEDGPGQYGETPGTERPDQEPFDPGDFGEARDDEGSASDGIPRPWELPPDALAGGLEATEPDVIRRAVAIAYRSATRDRPGHKAGDLDRWAQRLAEPRIPWEHLLAQATRRGVGWTSGRTHTTYTRPNRRAASTPNILMPGWRRQNPTVACVVDTSASVDDTLLGRALGEVDGALRALGVGTSDLTLLSCDASVQTVARLRRAHDAALVGGGGTDLRVALAAVDRLRPRPTLTVVFTDGQTPWPDAPPTGCAVVVALLLRPDREPPPVPEWATVVECRPGA